MRITIYDNGEVFIPDKLMGFVGENQHREIQFVFTNVTGASTYILRIEYDDGIVYDVPIENFTAEIGGSVLRKAGKVKCQWVAYAIDDEDAYTIVAKSVVFELIIGESVSDDIEPIPPYEQIISAAQALVNSGMTREQIATMLYEIVETGEISDVTVGVITTLNEQNHNVGFRVWLGTTEEYNALTGYEDNVLYIKTDDTTPSEIRGITDNILFGEKEATETLSDVVGEGKNFQIYRVEPPILNTNIYPETVSYPTQSNNSAVVAQFVANGVGFLLFEYSGDLYICHSYQSTGGRTFGNWVKLTKSDTTWQTLSISGTGFSAGAPTPKYRMIDNHVYIKGQVNVNMSTVTDITTVFATLPSGYRPATSTYRLIAGEGDRQARLYVNSNGNININYFKTYSGETVTGSHWVQIDCDFLTD